MAAIVTGLIPILRTAVDATTTYKCCSLWFGFLCIRVVILLLAELLFTKLDVDFTCNGTRDSICTKLCFNEHFNKPMMVAWNFIVVLVVLSVLIIELFTSHLQSLAQKRNSQMRSDVNLETGGTEEAQVVSTDIRAEAFIDLHRDRGTVSIYLLSIALRVLAEAWFVYVLLFWNLPALNISAPYKCSTHICRELHVCVVRAAPEKRMSIYALASISGVIIVCSLLFFLYSIAHYLCNFH